MDGKIIGSIGPQGQQGQGGGPPQRGPQQGGPDQPQVKIDLAQQPDISCDACGGMRFTHEVYYLKRLSALVSPTGNEEVVPIGPLFSCEECGHVNDSFVPPALRGRNNTTQRNESDDEDGPTPNFTTLE